MRIAEALGLRRTGRFREQTAVLWVVDMTTALITLIIEIVWCFPPGSSFECTGRGVVDEVWFRTLLLFVCAWRWLWIGSYLLRLAFMEVNVIVEPIMTALTKTFQFCFACMGFATIMWQAYWTLDIKEWSNGWKAIIIAFRFAMLGDFEVEEMEGVDGTYHPATDGSGNPMWEYQDPELHANSTVVRMVFVVMGGIVFPVLILNVLISVLGVWLNFAIDNVWLRFQQSRARAALKYKATRRGLFILFCRKVVATDEDDEDTADKRSETDNRYIWFASPKDEDVLEDDVQPGIMFQFKEAAEKMSDMDRRLEVIDASTKALVIRQKKMEAQRQRVIQQQLFTPEERKANRQRRKKSAPLLEEVLQ